MPFIALAPKTTNLPEQNVGSSAFDYLVSRLGSIVIEAANLQHEDQKRLTNFVLAAGSMMLARTRLPPGDQKLFEAHLRQAVSGQAGS